MTVVGHWGAYPEVNEATSGYLIQHKNKNILIDCGCGVLSKLQNFIRLEELDAVVLSHYHADHSGDVYPLQYAIMILRHLGKRNNSLKIYGLDNDEKFETLNYGNSCKAYPIRSNFSTDIEGLKFSFIKTSHPVPCLAMRIEDDNSVLAYTADTDWCDDLIDISKDANLLLCECNLYNDQKGRVAGHLTAGEAGIIASRSNAKNLILTHLPHNGDYNILIREANEHYKQKINLANFGLTFDTEGGY